MHERLAIGVMTGTSFDGIDAAAVSIEGEGLAIRARFLEGVSSGLGPGRAGLRELTLAGVVDAERFLASRLDYSEALADAAELVARRVGTRPTLVALHGQTVFHRPPLSWQVVEPWVVARRLGCPVVSDLRGADLAAAGQGAPITPLADWVLFRDAERERAIVNLGGFCNVTLLRAGADTEAVEGFDVCACNHVLDAAARAGLALAFDDAGAAALRGTPDPHCLEELTKALGEQAGSGRSLGSGDEGVAVVEDWAARLQGESLVASAAAGVGAAIARAIRRRVSDGAELLLAGGGARNQALSAAIARDADGLGVRPIDETGLPGAFREAACMAVLGALAADGVSVTLTRVTGAREPIPLGGSWVNVRVNLGG